MIDQLLALLLTLTLGQPAEWPAPPLTCLEDEIQVGQLCVHSEGDGWRRIPII